MMEHKKIAYFGTAGFGGSKEYYQVLFERIKSIVPPSNETLSPPDWADLESLKAWVKGFSVL